MLGQRSPRTFDVETGAPQAPPTPNHSSLDPLARSTSVHGTASGCSGVEREASMGPRECRICLGNDRQDQLTSPCGCTGSVRYAHGDCLTSWMKERRSYKCELCHHEYAEPFKTNLQEYLRQFPAGTDPLSAGYRTTDQYQPTLESGSISSGSWRSFWCHVLILTCLMGAIIYLTCFSSVMNTGGGWTAVIWRILTVLIPVYIVGRISFALFVRWRLDQRAAARAREVRAMQAMRADQQAQQQQQEQQQQQRDAGSDQQQRQAGSDGSHPQHPDDAATAQNHQTGSTREQQQRQQQQGDGAPELCIVVMPSSDASLQRQQAAVTSGSQHDAADAGAVDGQPPATVAGPGTHEQGGSAARGSPARHAAPGPGPPAAMEAAAGPLTAS